MNSDTIGSFPIVCRLIRALRKTHHHPVSQAATLQAFLERYSTDAKDLSILFQLLLAEVDTSSHNCWPTACVWSDAVSLLLVQQPPQAQQQCNEVEPSVTSCTVEQQHHLPPVAAKVLAQFCTNYGSATLREVFHFIREILHPLLFSSPSSFEVAGPPQPPEAAKGRPSISSSEETSHEVKLFLRRVTIEEWVVVTLIASGSVMALMGGLSHPEATTLAQEEKEKEENATRNDRRIQEEVGAAGDRLRESILRSVFGPSAAFLFRSATATASSRVAKVVVASTDGSPRMLRESSISSLLTHPSEAPSSTTLDTTTKQTRARETASPPSPSSTTSSSSRVLVVEDGGFLSPDVLSDADEITTTTTTTSEPPRKMPRVEVASSSPDGTVVVSSITSARTTTAAAVAGGPVPRAADGRPMCMYGERCHRANVFHWKKYAHPAGCTMPSASSLPPSLPLGAPASIAPTAAAAPASYTPSVMPATPTSTATTATTTTTTATTTAVPHDYAIRGVAPLRVMKEYEFVYPENTGGGYKMKNCGGGVYTCSCPVWRFQNKNTDARTCKHLQAYLGAEFEAARCSDGSEVGTTSLSPPTSPRKAAGGAPTAAGAPIIGGKVGMPGVLLANKANEKGNYIGWWVSEKLDGVRAYWDGTHLLSRNGNVFTAPPSFTSALPKHVTLDGELFGGRKKFQSTVGIVKSSAAHPGWASLTYEIFDIPSSGTKPFEERMSEVLSYFPKGGPVTHVHVVEQQLVTSDAQLKAELQRVEALGGEGLMLREPKSKYVHARSNTLLKIKSTEEVDAMVKGHDPGKGKHAGRCGALLVELANGKQFCVGSGLSDAQRSAPPPIGTVVVVRFQELTDGGIPRFPVFVGCRYDIDWSAAKAAAAASAAAGV